MTGFVALIPARLASTRLPDKPLADIGGRPMIVRVAERALASGANRVAVATDSRAIADAVEAAGFTAVITRADHPSGTDRLAEAANRLGLDDHEIVVNVQGDEPLIPPALIASVATTLAEHDECPMSTAAHPIERVEDLLNPNVVKVVLDHRSRALYFSRAPIPFARDALAGFPQVLPSQLPVHADAPLPVLRHIGLYAYRAAFLREYPRLPTSPLESIEALEQLRALWNGHAIAVRVTGSAPAAGVDTLADLERVRRVWVARQAGHD